VKKKIDWKKIEIVGNKRSRGKKIVKKVEKSARKFLDNGKEIYIVEIQIRL